MNAEVFHVWDFIEEELEARGWTRDDLAAHMGPSHDVAIHRLAIEFLADYRSPDVVMEGSMATALAHAFGTSPDLYINLHAQWKAAQPRRNNVE